MSDTPDKADLTKKMVFTTGEAAALCKVSQQTIIRCFDSGRLDGFRVPGSKFRRIPRDELIRFMRKNEIPTDILETGPKRILAVDDDPQILELFEDLFSRDDRFAIQTASTPRTRRFPHRPRTPSRTPPLRLCEASGFFESPSPSRFAPVPPCSRSSAASRGSVSMSVAACWRGEYSPTASR